MSAKQQMTDRQHQPQQRLRLALLICFHIVICCYLFALQVTAIPMEGTSNNDDFVVGDLAAVA
jgi:hypothetical protein